MEYYIGIDLGGTTINIGAISAEGEVIQEVVLCTDPESGPLNAIKRIQKSIQEIETSIGNSSANETIVVGLPGIINTKTGTIIQAGNLPGWENFTFQESLSLATNKDVIIKNDADMAALGETWVGAGKSFDNALMITLGSGVGGALVVNNKLFEINNISGEFGHMVVNTNGALCSCGRRGCVETYFSRYGLLRITREKLGNKNILGEKNVDDITPFDLATLAKKNNLVAKEILKVGINGLATGMANVSNVFGITDFIIGGGISNAWGVFYDLLLESVNNQIFNSKERNIKLVKANLGEKAGIIGAVKFGFDIAATKIEFNAN